MVGETGHSDQSGEATDGLATERLVPDDAGIAHAAALLRAGQVVAFPTETVYGLGGDATDPSAVAAIYAAKQRPRFNPLIAHVPDAGMAQSLLQLDHHGMQLAKAFWPGPLTLVATMQPGCPVASLATAGLETLAVRVPASPLARRLLRAVDRPVAAPSANPSGGISPTTATHVLSGLDGRIAAVLDGGACTVGLESTIVGLSPEGPVLLREGGVSVEEIEAALGRPLRAAGDAIVAPGQMASHYAPVAPVLLDGVAPDADHLLLGFGGTPGATLDLSPGGDLAEAAANLFDALHRLDAMAAGRPIAIAPIPDTGLGRSINDRLRRAAAPR